MLLLFVVLLQVGVLVASIAGLDCCGGFNRVCLGLGVLTLIIDCFSLFLLLGCVSE